MSVSWGTQYSKLKSNLRLASNRFKLLQKKKTELAQKARVEITKFIESDKDDRARIRVESIIREDFVVEAYELLEMYCELLLARFGIIQQMKELDDGIAEAVTSLLWAAPRLSHEVQELKIINDQLQQKYGKQFAEAARMNQLPEPTRVSPKLVQKLSVSAPSKLLVEKYLIEIAKYAGIEFVPDPKVMRDDENEIVIAERNLMNFMNEEQIGWNVGQNTSSDNRSNNFGGSIGGGGNILQQPPSYSTSNYPPPPPLLSSEDITSNLSEKSNIQPPTLYPVNQPPSYQHRSASDSYLNDNYSSNGNQEIQNTKSVASFNEEMVPKFPDPPSGSLPHTNEDGRSNNVDFDALTKRFNELKKKI